MDMTVILPVLLSLIGCGLFFHGIVSLVKLAVEIKLHKKDKTNSIGGEEQ